MPRKDDLTFLVSNCSCEETDLDLLDDDTLSKLAGNVRAGSENTFVVNQLKEGMKVPVETPTDEFGTILEQRLIAIANAMTPEEDDAEDAADEGADEEAEGEPPIPPGKGKKKKSTNNSEGPMTHEQWMAAASPEGQEMLNHAQEVLNQSKAAIANRLVANIAVDKRKNKFNALMAKPLSELREIAEFAANAKTLPSGGDYFARYGGAQGGDSFFLAGAEPTLNAKEDAEDIELMTPPSYNAFEKSSK